MNVFAITIAFIDDYVGVEAVFLDEFGGEFVAEEEFVGVEVEDVDLWRTDLSGFGGDVYLARVENPQTVAAVRLDPEDRC